MSTASTNSGFVRGVSHWYLCVVSLMAAQVLLLLLWSFLGPSNGLNRILDSVYGTTARYIGMLFFEEQMSLGNVPLGLSLLVWTIILYSLAAGSVVYLGYRLFMKRVPPNKQ